MPNELLMQALARAGWSNKGCAARLRAFGEARGVELRCTHVDVRRWLDGVQPRPQTAVLIAEALSDALGAMLTPSALGFDYQARGALSIDSLHYADALPDTYRSLTSTAERDISGSIELQKAAAVSSAWTGPLMAWLLSRPESVPVNATGRRVGMAEVAAVCSTIKLFMNLDFQFGGGHARTALAQYFRHDVLPLLDGIYSESVGRRLFSAAAEVAQLLGWTAYDLGQHGLAQRYLIQGLRLAQAGGDRVMGGRLLANMSHQANYLGHHQEAAQLARAAQEGTRGVASATVSAMFLAMEARARAGAGDSRSCASVLREAESAFNRRAACDDPPWIYYFDEAEMAGEAAHCFRDLRSPVQALEFVTQAIALTDPAYVRTHAFIRLVNAASCLHTPTPDVGKAAEVALEAIHLAGALKSERYLRYVRDLRSDFTPHAGSAEAKRALATFDVVLAGQ
ncbi:hypothetical protein ABT344_11475 [Micromonospora carbonacea]|uniref:hypothetical protein n=1 Tax=Micromonospora carbonacea TaxID=47853 RepID=UPI003328563B